MGRTGGVQTIMSNKAKVGDVVAWADVPDGALVREHDGIVSVRHFEIGGRSVFAPQSVWAFGVRWDWGTAVDQQPVTIIALNVPADATAEHLRELAERFEVREALGTMMAGDHETERALEDAIRGAAVGPTMGDVFAAMMTIADRLYRAGWRKGMTAKDAARLLTVKGSA